MPGNIDIENNFLLRSGQMFLLLCHHVMKLLRLNHTATQNSRILILFDNRIHIRRIIKENAVYEKRSTYRRCCWYVHAEVLTRHSQEALPVPCQWTYLTSGAQITRDEPAGSQGSSPTSSTSTTPSNKRKSASSHSITKYMKKCGDSEQVQICFFVDFFLKTLDLCLTLWFIL